MPVTLLRHRNHDGLGQLVPTLVAFLLVHDAPVYLACSMVKGKNRTLLDKLQGIQVRANFPSRRRVKSLAFGIRGLPRSGFARRGEKIACSDWAQGPHSRLVARCNGEFLL